MKRLRTVVADDNDGFRAAVIAFLRTLAVVTVVGEARDGEEAIHCVDDLAPDLLILDLAMPKLNGWQVFARLQNLANPPQVIILSSYAVPVFSPVVAGRGVYAYLEKDNPKALNEAVVALAKTMDAASN